MNEIYERNILNIPTRRYSLRKNNRDQQDVICNTGKMEEFAKLSVDEKLNKVFQALAVSESQRKLDLQNLKDEFTGIIKLEVKEALKKSSENKKEIDKNSREIQKASREISEIQTSLAEIKRHIANEGQSTISTTIGSSFSDAVLLGQEKIQPTRTPPSRANNIVIHGVPEGEEAETRRYLNDLLTFLEVPFSIETGQVHVLRLGSSKNKSEDHPRPVKLQFRNPDERNECFKNIRKLKGVTKFDKIRLSDDLTPRELSFRQDLQCVGQMCKEKGYKYKIKNDTILVQDTLYTRATIDKLPHDISMEMSKTVPVDKGAGIAFQSEWSYLSNFSKSPIVFKNQGFTSVEQGYIYGKAMSANARDICENILQTTDPYELKQIGKSIINTTKWETTREKLLLDLMTLKFTQNPDLTQKLRMTKDAFLYEAVLDRTYGCGITLRNKEDINRAAPGLNKTGQNLMYIRSHCLN